MSIPNVLTLFRLFLIPVFMLVFFSGIVHNLAICIIIFIAAGITDILDGYIARKFNCITESGTVLDPLADKLMIIAVLTCLVINYYIPLWILLIITVKDISMILIGIFLYKTNNIIASNFFGKAATFIFYMSIVLLFCYKPLGVHFIYVAVAAQIVALTNYTFIYFTS